MGLDVIAYRKIEAIDDGEREDEGTYIHAENFEGRLDGILPGYYNLQEPAEAHFRMSYGSYSRWRECLAQSVLAYAPIDSPTEDWQRRYPYTAHVVLEADSGPFYELINFTDCDGFIGPKTAQKLAAHFTLYESRLSEHYDKEFFKKFLTLKSVFLSVGPKGVVCFG